MIKKTFKYCATHKDDERYMQEMCLKGWAAIKLVEGFWTFEECEPGEYCYRICYLRGMSKDEVDNLKKNLALQDIQFVSQYSFWVILRSHHDFQLYDDDEDIDICQKIYKPMPIGAFVSWFIFIIGTILSYRIHFVFFDSYSLDWFLWMYVYMACHFISSIIISFS